MFSRAKTPSPVYALWCFSFMQRRRFIGFVHYTSIIISLPQLQLCRVHEAECIFYIIYVCICPPPCVLIAVQDSPIYHWS